MAKAFVKHKMGDFTTWKKAFDDFLPQRRSGGALSYSVGHVAGEPSNLCLVFERTSVADANTCFASPELKAAMEKATVAEAPEIFVFEVAEEGRT